MTATTSTRTDLVDEVLGVTPGSTLDVIRRARGQARENAQRSYLALFEPDDETRVTEAERLAVAVAVTTWHRSGGLLGHYAGRLAAQDAALGEGVAAVAAAGVAEGPCGAYREASLVGESTEGPVFRVSDADRARLGARLATALEHAHLLVFRPREAAPENLRGLLDAGWDTTGVVTLSQLVAFLTFQVRLVHGLAVLDGEAGATTAATIATEGTR